MQTVEIVNVKMAKFRLDYIVEPTAPKVEGRRKETDILKGKVGQKEVE